MKCTGKEWDYCNVEKMGCEGCYYNEDNDRNIEILEEKINNIKKYSTYRYDWTETDIQTVEHLIKAYKKLEEENAMLKKVNKITENITTEEIENAIKEANKNYIPVSLVEEKILNPMKEEHDKAIKGFIKRDIPQCIEDGGIAQELGYFIGKIEELLEKRK